MFIYAKNRGVLKTLFSISIFLIFIAVLMAWGKFSGNFVIHEGIAEPDLFVDRIETIQQAYSTQPAVNLPIGYTYANTLVQLVKTLLYKPGGYLSNDIKLSSKRLENLKAWEFGVIIILRDGTTALRNHFSSESEQSHDPDLALAEPYFYFPYDSWALPSTESEYKKGIEAMYRYMVRLENNNDYPRNYFYTGSDQLSQYLQTVVERLNGLQTILTINTEQTTDKNQISAEQSNIYFEARGVSWGLIHIFTAIKYDFSETLTMHKAIYLIENIIKELKKGLVESSGEEICIQCLANHLLKAKQDLIKVQAMLET